MDGRTAEQVLLRLQDELKALQLQPIGMGDSGDFKIPPSSKGSGPRLFCGHVPKEATEDLVKAHFSRWGLVTDVYFPRHKKTLKRRPFCFVTFATREAAELALSESPLSICGIPIKNLTMVEDRDKYYKEKHSAAQQALLTALNSMGAAGTLAPEQVNNIAALLAMEGVSSEAVLNMLLQGGVSPPQVPPLTVAQGMAQPGMAFPQQNMGFAGPSPQMSSDFFLQQAQTQQQQSYGSLSMRSASGPLPSSFGPFGTMMSREGSLSSLSSISDWYSSNSSARTSLDLGTGGIFGQGVSPAAPRRSLDAALQLRQQLMAVAAVAGAGGNVSNMPGVSVASGQQWNAATRLSPGGAPQGPSGPQIMQSAFYQASSIPLPQHQSQQQQQQQQQNGAIASANSMPLPVIREGMPSAVNAFPTDLWAASGFYGPSATTSPVRRSPVGPMRGMEYGALGASSAPPLMPLSLPDSSSSEQDSTNVSSRTPSGTLEAMTPGWQPPPGSAGDNQSRYSI